MPFKPSAPGEVPTLGPVVVDWMESHLARPDTGEGLIELTQEQINFLLHWYELGPIRRYRRGVLSRSKGWGRSPFLAAIALAEAFAPVVPDGWDADGRPVGKPWAAPWVQIAACSEDQTRNSWLPLLDMVNDGPLADEPGVEALRTFVTLPRGRLEYVTASAISREGNRPTFVVMDQTESWSRQNGGTKLAAVLRRNLGKTNGSSIEAPNSYRPGSGSVSEASFMYSLRITAGQAHDDGLLWDHREAPPALELAAGVNADDLLEGLRYAYGDSSADPRGCVLHKPACAPGWVDLPRIVREILDLDTAPEDASQFYLNRPTSEADALITKQQFDRVKKPSRPLRKDLRFENEEE